MRIFVCFLVVFNILMSNIVFATEVTPIELSSPSAILLDKYGNIIFEENAHELREPASVTKIMTLLLTFEAIESGQISLDDIVTVSELAQSQGGTQVYLEKGEQISVDELIKSVAVSSANDAATALAEYISGSRDAFVDLMNQRAKELSMNNTTFKNPTGLHTEGHLTTAFDIALMSVELLKHEKIYAYTTIWMDSIRDGSFELANTNKLLKSYDGIVGLKTGYTSQSMYCISAVANRDSQEFIAIVMGAETIDNRTNDVCKMLDYAFNNYKITKITYENSISPVKVVKGVSNFVDVEIIYPTSHVLLKNNSEITHLITLEEYLQAPVNSGEKIGQIEFFSDGKELLTADIVTKYAIPELTFQISLQNFLKYFFMYF